MHVEFSGNCSMSIAWSDGLFLRISSDYFEGIRAWVTRRGQR
jgi:hypothetical protein